MSARLTIAQMQARAEAYNEAADHLVLTWTDDPVEIAQGKIVEAELRHGYERWMMRAIGAERAMSRAANPA